MAGVEMTFRLRVLDAEILRRLADPGDPGGLAAAVGRGLLRSAFAVQARSAEDFFIRSGRIGKSTRERRAHPRYVTSRTGRLRGSISADRAVDRSGLPLRVRVGSDVVYAAVHEYGWPARHIRARPYLRPAFELELDRFPDLIATELRALHGVV